MLERVRPVDPGRDVALATTTGGPEAVWSTSSSSKNLYRNPEGNPFSSSSFWSGLAETNVTLLWIRSRRVEKAESGRSAPCAPLSSNAPYNRRAAVFCERAATHRGVSGARVSAWARRPVRVRRKDRPCGCERRLSRPTSISIRRTRRPVPTFPRFRAPRHRGPSALADIRPEISLPVLWLEWGGAQTRFTTANDQTELCNVVYGVWDHNKNRGASPTAENHT
jgi:hypothetical protein